MRTALKFCTFVPFGMGMLHSTIRITLSEAMQMAMKGNAGLQEQQWEVAQSEADRVTAGLRPNPQLQLTGDVLDFHDRPVVQPEKKFYGMSLQLPVEFPGKRGRRVAVAEDNLHAGKSGYREMVRQTLLNAGNAWLDAVQAGLNLGTAVKAEAILDSIVAINEIRLRNRVIAPIELTRSRILADQYEISRREAELALARALQALGLLLGSVGAVEPEENDTAAFVPPDADSCVALALKQRGEWLQAGDALEAAKANEQYQRLLALPDFNVSLDYSSQQGTPFYGASIGIPLPLLGHNQGESARAHAVAREAAISREFLRARIESEVRLLHREFSVRRAGIGKLKDLLDSAEQVRSMVAYSYRRGITPIFDLLDAQKTWYDAQQSYHDAWVDFRRIGLQLMAACGLLGEEEVAAAPPDLKKE